MPLPAPSRSPLTTDRVRIAAAHDPAASGARVSAVHWDPRRPDSWREPPVALAGRVAPTPLLVVPGDRDASFPLEHAEALYAAARAPRELWVVPGFGHAEVVATPDLLARVGRWGAGGAAGRAAA